MFYDQNGIKQKVDDRITMIIISIYWKIEQKAIRQPIEQVTISQKYKQQIEQN